MSRYRLTLFLLVSMMSFSFAAPPNKAPNADAGVDQTVIDTDGDGFETVTLDGTGSSDRTGSIVSYIWTDESDAEIGNGATPDVDFAVGTHTVTLTVTDDGGLFDDDMVVITVSGAPQPEAVKGPYMVWNGNNTEMTVYCQFSESVSSSLNWGTSTAYGNTVSSVGLGDNLYSYTITGLTPGTKYFYNVNGAGSGSFTAARRAMRKTSKYWPMVIHDHGRVNTTVYALR